MSKREYILVSGGINWTWYCHVRLIGQNRCEVTKEYRLHDFDEYQGAGKHPKKTDGSYRILENSLDESRIHGRIAKGVYVELKGKPGKNYYFETAKFRWDLGKQA